MNFNNRALEMLEHAIVGKNYKQGNVVIWEGDESSEMFIVKRGWLKVVKKSVAGREVILNLLKSGDTLNAMSAFIRFTNPATVIALEDSLLLSIKYDKMSDMLEHDPQIAKMLLQNFAGRLQKMTDMVGNLSLQPVDVRLAELLITGAEDNIFKRKKWLTQGEMAALIGTVPDVINRLLNELVEKKVIELNRNQIRILNREYLEKKTNFINNRLMS